MGKVFPFDKREAEAYARALRKQREREARAREEKAIWNGLVAEQLAANRTRAAAVVPISKARRQRPPPKTDEERGMDAIANARGILDEWLERRTAEVHAACRLVIRNPYPMNNDEYAALDTILQSRVDHQIYHFPDAVRLWGLRVRKFLGEQTERLEVGSHCIATHRTLVRRTREALRNAPPETRATVLRVLRDLRYDNRRKRAECRGYHLLPLCEPPLKPPPKDQRQTPIIRYEDGRPVIACTLHGTIQVKFWCGHCLKYHFHGHAKTPHSIGHREAHCWRENSPFKERGYILELAR